MNVSRNGKGNIVNQPVTLCSEVTWPSAGFCLLLKLGSAPAREVGRDAVLASCIKSLPHPGPGHRSQPGDGHQSHAGGLEEPGSLFWLRGCSRQLWRQGGSHVPWPHYRSGLNSFSCFICQIVWALWKLNLVCIFLVYVLVYYKTPWNLTQMPPLCKNYHSSFKMGKIQLFNILIGKKKISFLGGMCLLCATMCCCAVNLVSLCNVSSGVSVVWNFPDYLQR